MQRNKQRRCGLCGSTKDVGHQFGVPYALKCKKCYMILKKYFKADEANKSMWRWANGVDDPLEDEWDIGKRIAEIETYCGELKRVLDCLKKDGKLDGEIIIAHKQITEGKHKGKFTKGIQKIKGGKRYGNIRAIRFEED